MLSTTRLCKPTAPHAPYRWCVSREESHRMLSLGRAPRLEPGERVLWRAGKSWPRYVVGAMAAGILCFAAYVAATIGLASGEPLGVITERDWRAIPITVAV